MKALLAVSFGTTYSDAETTCIRPVEQALQDAFSDRILRRAFTSRMIIKKLAENGIAVENETQALARLKSEGCEDILVVPTNIIPGEEYHLTVSAAQGLPVSEPLLYDDNDLAWMADLLSGIAREEGRTLVVMGHGTDHAADETYLRLRRRLPDSVLLACVEGSHTLESILPELATREDRRFTLMPMMLVAGDHAHNDLAGAPSWKTRLAGMGYDVRVRMQGLGAIPEAQQRFVEKARRALEKNM